MSQEITPRELVKQMENGQAIRLLDVRQVWEAQLANLPTGYSRSFQSLLNLVPGTSRSFEPSIASGFPRPS